MRGMVLCAKSHRVLRVMGIGWGVAIQVYRFKPTRLSPALSPTTAYPTPAYSIPQLIPGLKYIPSLPSSLSPAEFLNIPQLIPQLILSGIMYLTRGCI